MIFEYKVKCRHKLGWKEIKLYADTDIEEFFNRNGIEYVRNITDTIEHRQLKEIERLHSIIKEVREYIEEHQCCGGKINVMTLTEYKELLEILDKGE